MVQCGFGDPHHNSSCLWGGALWYSLAFAHPDDQHSVIILTLVLERRLGKKEVSSKCVMFWLLYFITLVPSLGLIGVFEGIYNHLLKNIMYFGGAGDGLLLTLFPAPTYEMPNDLLFEITGVMQGVIAIVLIKQMVALTLSLFKVRQPA